MMTKLTKLEQLEFELEQVREEYRTVTDELKKHDW
jgi:hypothetical protein